MLQDLLNYFDIYIKKFQVSFDERKNGTRKRATIATKENAATGWESERREMETALSSQVYNNKLWGLLQMKSVK